MAIHYAAGKTTASAKLRLSVAMAAGVITLLVVGSVASWRLAPLVAWDVAALLYAAWIWSAIWPLNSEDTAKFSVREDPSRGTSDVIVLGASIISLAAVGLALIEASHNSGTVRLLQVALGVLSVVLSWVVVHTLFTLRYAELYYTTPVGGINFKESAGPAYSDFAYLAFTIGMTFQVSDTELTEKKFRSTALRHALISYLFGTVIVATTINLVAGLSK
jgi:uncharacterized membrane protein